MSEGGEEEGGRYRQLQEDLKQETKSRQRQEELNCKLQDEYDILLKKLAQAELHIDQLRLRANVNINKRFVLSHDSRQTSTLQQDLLGSRALQETNLTQSRSEQLTASSHTPAVSEAGNGRLSTSHSYATSVSTHAPSFKSFQDPSPSEEHLAPQQGFSDNSFPDQRGLQENSPDNRLDSTSGSLPRRSSQAFSDTPSESLSQLSAGYVSSQASAESQHLAKIFRIRSLQEQITALKNKLNENQSSFDELSDDLGAILDNHEQLTRNFTDSKAQLDSIKEKYKDKAEMEISRRKQVLENELLGLADQLKELDALLRSKTHLNSPTQKSPQCDQYQPSPPAPHRNQLEPPASPHPTNQLSSKAPCTLEDVHSDDSLNSPALPSKYLTGETNLNSTNSSGDQGLDSHSTAALSSEMGLLDTSSLMSNFGGDQESRSLHVNLPRDDSAEGLKQVGRSQDSGGLGNEKKEAVNVRDRQSQGTKSLSSADGRPSKWSFRSRIPRRVHGSLASPPKLVPLRRRSEQPGSGVKRDSISEIRLRKASSPAVLQSKSEGENVSGSLKDGEQLAPADSVGRLKVSTGVSHLPGPRHAPASAESTPRKGILKLHSSSVSNSDSSTLHPIEEGPQHHQETVSSDRKASSSVGEGLRSLGVVPEISVTPEKGVAEGRRGEGRGIKDTAQQELKEVAGREEGLAHEGLEDDVEQRKSKLTLATMDALRKELLALKQQLLKSVPPSPTQLSDYDREHTRFRYDQTAAPHAGHAHSPDWRHAKSPPTHSNRKSQMILSSLAPGVDTLPHTPTSDRTLPTTPTSDQELPSKKGESVLSPLQVTDSEQVETPTTTPAHQTKTGTESAPHPTPEHDTGIDLAPIATPPGEASGMESSPIPTPQHVSGININGMEPETTYAYGMEPVHHQTNPTLMAGIQSLSDKYDHTESSKGRNKRFSDAGKRRGHEGGNDHSTKPSVRGDSASKRGHVQKSASRRKRGVAPAPLSGDVQHTSASSHQDKVVPGAGMGFGTSRQDPSSPTQDGRGFFTPPHTPPYSPGGYHYHYHISPEEGCGFADHTPRTPPSPKTPPSSPFEGEMSPPYLTPVTSQADLTPVSSKPPPGLDQALDHTPIGSFPSLSDGAIKSSMTDASTIPDFLPSDTALLKSHSPHSPLGYSFTESQLGSYLTEGVGDTSLSSFGQHTASPRAKEKSHHSTVVKSKKSGSNDPQTQVKRRRHKPESERENPTGVMASDQFHSRLPVSTTEKGRASSRKDRVGSSRGKDRVPSHSTRQDTSHYSRGNEDSDHVRGGGRIRGRYGHSAAREHGEATTQGIQSGRSLETRQQSERGNVREAWVTGGEAEAGVSAKQDRATSPILLDDHKFSTRPLHSSSCKYYNPHLGVSHYTHFSHSPTRLRYSPRITPHSSLKSPSHSSPRIDHFTFKSNHPTIKDHSQGLTGNYEEQPAPYNDHASSKPPLSSTPLHTYSSHSGARLSRYRSPVRVPTCDHENPTTPPVSPVHAHLFTAPPPPSPDLADSHHHKRVFLYNAKHATGLTHHNSELEPRGGYREEFHTNYHQSEPTPARDRYNRKLRHLEHPVRVREEHEEARDIDHITYHHSVRPVSSHGPGYRSFEKGLLRKGEASSPVEHEMTGSHDPAGTCLHSRDPLLVVNIHKNSRGRHASHENWRNKRGVASPGGGGAKYPTWRRGGQEEVERRHSNAKVYNMDFTSSASDSDYEGSHTQSTDKTGIDLKAALKLARQLRRRSERMRGTLQMELTKQGLM